MEKKEVKEVKIGKESIAKTKFILIVSACLAIVILAIALPIGLIFGKKITVPTPEFYNFNDAEDEYIHVRWNKIRNAINYDYIFYYGNPEEAQDKDLTVNNTQNTTAPIQRHKGTVAFKVKANIIGEKTEYSDWITINVSAWKLSSPEITITNILGISWTPVTFEVDKTVYEVKNYEYEILIGEDIAVRNTKISATRLIAENYLKDRLKDAVTENVFDDWVDIPITVRVRAVTYVTFGDVILTEQTGADEFLPKIFEESDFGSQTLWVTKEIYDNL